jgi:hypothetical protein
MNGTGSTCSCADCKYLLIRKLLEMKMKNGEKEQCNEEEEYDEFSIHIKEKPFCMHHGMYIGWMISDPEKGCDSFVIDELKPIIMTIYPPDESLRSFAIVDESCPGCNSQSILIDVEPYCGGINISCKNCGEDLVYSHIGELVLRYLEDEAQEEFQRIGEEIFIFNGKLEEKIDI